MELTMNYCSNCGHPVHLGVPAGDDRNRYLCGHCGTIHYQNPKMVVGCIPEWEGKILLCRRSIEPRYGYWTLPAGYLENGETVADGARREAFEEARVRMAAMEPYALFNLAFVNQIYFMFRGPMAAPDVGAGDESLAVRLFTEEDIPWDDLAFTVMRETLTRYFQDRKQGGFSFHMGDIAPASKSFSAPDMAGAGTEKGS